jgi:predicted kinase
MRSFMAALLLIVAGPPCSGKSTLAGLIESELGIGRLQVDSILSALIPDSKRERNDRDIAYRAMHMLARELLGRGHAVSLDATYGTQIHRQAVEAIVADLAIPLFLMECHVSPDTAAARFNARCDHPALDLTEERVRDLARRYCFTGLGLAVNEEMTVAAALNQVAHYLLAARPISIDGAWSAASAASAGYEA